ncbi:MAG: 4-oxalomesaconate tautomerase [Cellvibrionaceae bacterium]
MINRNLMAEQRKIPCVLMRGGTSKGPYFLKEDLPSNDEDRDDTLLKIMGSPHPMQLDGVGGALPQTSKVAIVSLSNRDDADIDYLFAQVMVEEQRVDVSPNCGNMLSGVAPFAIEEGLFPALEGSTTVRIFNINTGVVVHSEVQTPKAKVTYEGAQKIDGVNGVSAPILLHFLNAEGVKTGRLFPTEKQSEYIQGLSVTLIDYSVPMMLLCGHSLELNGSETPDEIDENKKLLKKIEEMRIEAGRRMGLGDVSQKVIPKVGILSGSEKGLLKSHYLMPHKCHKSHAITGAMCITAACYSDDTVASKLTGEALKGSQSLSVEHPSGVIDLSVKLEESGSIQSIAVVRTARRLFEGNVLVQ